MESGLNVSSDIGDALPRWCTFSCQPNDFRHEEIGKQMLDAVSVTDVATAQSTIKLEHGTREKTSITKECLADVLCEFRGAQLRVCSLLPTFRARRLKVSISVAITRSNL